MRNLMCMQIEKTRTEQLKSLKKEVNQLEFEDSPKAKHAGEILDSSCYMLAQIIQF